MYQKNSCLEYSDLQSLSTEYMYTYIVCTYTCTCTLSGCLNQLCNVHVRVQCTHVCTCTYDAINFHSTVKVTG